jgi:IS5 family transposase
MSKIFYFINKATQLAKIGFGGRGEVAAPEEDGGFVNYAVVSLHCPRIYMEKSYREALDLPSEMPQILWAIRIERLISHINRC